VNPLSAEGWISVISLSAAVILFIMVIALWAKTNKLRRTLANMTAGAAGDSLEKVLTDIQENLRRLNGESARHDERLTALEKRMTVMKGRVALHRYNAFGGNGNGGSDLSFSLAIVDDERNGAVVTAIHGRDETFVYGKPVTGGRSDYKLTPEELEAIGKAMGDKQA